jgi:hypothetical protein
VASSSQRSRLSYPTPSHLWLRRTSLVFCIYSVADIAFSSRYSATVAELAGVDPTSAPDYYAFQARVSSCLSLFRLI